MPRAPKEKTATRNKRPLKKKKHFTDESCIKLCTCSENNAVRQSSCKTSRNKPTWRKTSTKWMGASQITTESIAAESCILCAHWYSEERREERREDSGVLCAVCSLQNSRSRVPSTKSEGAMDAATSCYRKKMADYVGCWIFTCKVTTNCFWILCWLCMNFSEDTGQLVVGLVYQWFCSL